MSLTFNHTAEEKRLIRKLGGVALKKHGADGTLRGRPVEVRSVRRDKRFRIQKDVHKELVRLKGSYILVKNGRPKVVSAKKVSKKIGRGKWFKDRNFPHKFLKVDDIF